MSNANKEEWILLRKDVDEGILQKQVLLLDKVVIGETLSSEERAYLRGLWELAHVLLDRLIVREERHESARNNDGDDGGILRPEVPGNERELFLRRNKRR